MNARCPFCLGTNVCLTSVPVIYFNEQIFDWYRCNHCKLIFILPFLRQDDVEKMYGMNYHDQFYFNYTEDYCTQVQLLSPYKGGHILDFGCGDAGLLNQWHINGFQTTGVEFNPKLVEKLSERFNQLRFLAVEKFWNDDTKYDVIHIGDVLEHMNEPLIILLKLTEKLTDKGVFFLEGPLETNPSLAGFFRQLTYRLKININADLVRVKIPYHVSFSNAHNQKMLFKNAGLEQLYFKISESGWPYIQDFREVKSPWLLVQWLISKTSIVVSTFIPCWGNRFAYIGKPALLVSNND